MKPERCERYRDRESLEGDGRWQGHLRRCPDCARQQRLDAMLRRTYAGLRRPQPTPGFEARLQAALEASRGGRRQSRSVDSLPLPAWTRWAQRLYWVTATGAAAMIVERAAAGVAAPTALGIAGAAGLVLAAAVTVAFRSLGLSPGILVTRSLDPGRL